MKKHKSNTSLFLTLILLSTAPSALLAQIEEDRPVIERTQSVLSGASFTLTTSMTFYDGPSLDQAFGVIAKPTYYQFMQKQSNNTGLQSVPTLITSYLIDHGVDEFNQRDLVGRSELLSDYIMDRTGVTPGYEMILTELIIQDVKARPMQWREAIEMGKNHLSFDEKINVASRLGGDFLSDYNYDRADGKGPKGLVSIEQMLQNLSNSDAGGVCRDISLAQSQILKQLGVAHNNIYTMSYANAGGHHAVVVVQDPDDPKRVIRINYDVAQETNGLSGAGSLDIKGTLTNVGTTYRIYDADGKPVELVSSDLGQMLREVTHGDQKFEDDIPGYTIQKVMMRSKWGTATLFNGNIRSSGDQVTGLALGNTFNPQGSDQHYDIGVAIVNRIGNDRLEESVDQQMIYARFKTWIEKYKMVGPIQFKGTVGSETELSLMNTLVERYSDGAKREGFNFDAHVTGFGGLEAIIRSQDGRSSLSAGVRSVVYLDFKNVASARDGGYKLVLDHTRYHVQADHKLTDRALVTGNVLLTTREVGKTLTFSARAEDTRTNSGVQINYQKPLDQIPLFFEGSTEVIGASVDKRWVRKNAKVKGSGACAFMNVRHDNDTNENFGGVGLEIKW